MPEEETNDPQDPNVESQPEETPAPQPQSEPSPEDFKEKLRQMEERMQILSDNNELLRMNVQQKHQEREEKPKKSADEVMTHGEFDQFKLDMLRENYETRMASSHKDYNDVVTKWLKKAASEDPTLMPDINMWYQRGQDCAQYAYRRIKQSKAYQDAHKQEQRNQVAEKVIANSQQPGNLSEVGVPAPVNAKTSYSNMSDEEFNQLHLKHLGLV